jgi:hypothetical protein
MSSTPKPANGKAKASEEYLFRDNGEAAQHQPAQNQPSQDKTSTNLENLLDDPEFNKWVSKGPRIL